MEINFIHKRALVIGGSSGIGNGIARSFLDTGAEVLVWGTRAEAAMYDGVEGSNLAGLEYRCVDVSSAEAVEAAASTTGPIDILVLSQGTVIYKRGEFAPAGWDRVVSVNLNSLLYCCQAFKGSLTERCGAIVIVSSVSGFQANKGNPAYAATKAAAVSLTKTLGQAWAPDGVRVNGVAPGLVDTKLTRVTTANPDRLQATNARKRMPPGARHRAMHGQARNYPPRTGHTE